MRVFKATLLTAVILGCTPALAQAQPIAGLIKNLFDLTTFNAASNVPHQPHFIVGETLKLTTREVNVSIASQVSAFPLPSSSGGFSFSINDRGEVLPTSTNFGPLFAERGVTIGKGQMNFGVSYQAADFNRFEGMDLGAGTMEFIRVHNDCCPPNNNNPTQETDFGPEFERDLLLSTLTASIETNTTAFFVNYGVTDRFDVGIAVPRVDVTIDATVVSEIIRTATFGNPFIHSFDGAGANIVSLSDRGSASGLGDILVRAKYNFYRTPEAAFAAALDLRLPTGDEDNLLGTGATQAHVFFIGSAEYGRFSPHVNFGYTFSSGQASDEATSFALDPQQFRLDLVPGGLDADAVSLEVPDEINYTVGFAVAPTPKVTLGFDIRGRTIRNVPRFELKDVVYENRGPGGLPSDPFVALDEFSVESREGDLNLLLGVVGGKFNVWTTFILNASLLFPLSDAGLKPDPVPVIGFDYLF